MRAYSILFSALACAAIPSRGEAPKFALHGQGWAETGQIVSSVDTIDMHVEGNRLQSVGAQFTAFADLGANVDAAIGFGTFQLYHSLGDKETERNTLSTFRNFITEARVTWSLGGKESSPLSITAGNFAFNYNTEVKNLGLYLLRGPVYPGFLVSGFKDFHTDTTRAAFTGARVHNTFGNFQNDLILTQEKDLPPSYDWSLAYVAKYKAFGALEIGGGVNFYHLLSENKGITRPSDKTYPGLYSNDSLTMAAGPYNKYDLQFIEVMPGGDTVFYTHKGVKLMGMFNLDLKPLLGMDGGGHDWEIYGEAAVIGVKDYGSVYNDIRQRIPVMLGVNVPTFGVLDMLSAEVEWYGARYRTDYSKLGIFSSLYVRGINYPNPDNAPTVPSPIPVKYKDTDNLTSDNLKWSVYAEKTVAGHLRFIGQVANDHYVPRPVRASGNAEEDGFKEAFSSLKDWYLMARIGYFF